MARGARFVRAIPAAVAAWSGAARGQTTLYVDDDAPPGGDGRSWTTAYRDLNDAVLKAAMLPPPVTVRIAGGTYAPRPAPNPRPRDGTFRLVTGTTLMGGYRGPVAGGDPDYRDPALFRTVLSGRLHPSFRADHVITASGGISVVLNGLTVQDGGDGLYSSGAAGVLALGSTVDIVGCTFSHLDVGNGPSAIEAESLLMTDCSVLGCAADTEANPAAVRANSAQLTRCLIARNHGGLNIATGRMTDCVIEDNGPGLLISGGGAALQVSNDAILIRCVIRGNGAITRDGAVFVGGTLTALNCVFSDNAGMLGSALRGRVAAYNSVFMDNVTTSDGGALAAYPGSIIVNCTFARNTGWYWGGGIWASGGVTIANCIVWDNMGGPTTERGQIYWAGGAPLEVRYCIVQGWTGTLGGTGNSGADPRLINASAGDVRLGDGSPAIDNADAAALPPDTFDLDGDGNTTEPLPLDLAMRVRAIDDPMTTNTGPGTPPFLDRGAFEFQTPACYANCDGSTAVPLLSVDDFVCFQARFAAGEPYANCDGSTGTPVLNVADLVCFQSRFVAGCP